MIDFQLLRTGMAEPPSINQGSTAGMSSPGGEGWGEGELIFQLKTESSPICQSMPLPGGIFVLVPRCLGGKNPFLIPLFSHFYSEVIHNPFFGPKSNEIRIPPILA